MAESAETAPKGGFLPSGVGQFLKRRATEAGGVAAIGIGAALLLAVTSYNPGDPSFNTAAAGPVANLLGAPGAYLADILVQSLGLAAALLALAPVFWGMRLLAHRPLDPMWLRFSVMPLALLLAATALAVLPAPQKWLLLSGLGGLAGDLILARIAYHTPLLAIWGAWPLAAAFGALAGLLYIWAAGLSVRATAALVMGAGRGVVGAVRQGAGLVRDGLSGLGRRKDRAEPLLVLDEAEDEEDAAPIVEEEPDLPAEVVLAEPPKPKKKPAAKPKQRSLDLAGEGFRLPPNSLLAEGTSTGNGGMTKDSLEQTGRLLETVLEDFGVRGKIVRARPGPVVTLFELEPAPGTKTSRVIGLSDDIARSMSAISVRVAVVPGRNVIGIEMPNAKRQTVYLREVFQSDTFQTGKTKLPLALGKDIGGTPVVADLAKMPHLLVAGTTGSGKSVSVNAMILSLLYKMTPDQCRFIMIDPKMLELSIYEGIPHLLAPVVTEPAKAVVALKWTVREMESRYRAMSKLGVRNIDGYNERIAQAKKKGEVLSRRVQTGFDADSGNPVFEDQPLDMELLPYIVVVVDEMADLMLVAGKDIEAAIQRLAQMARAAGIHLIMATQRPSVDVITGTIKANFPTRISFQVTSKIDSRTILGEQGAETLLGMGDMLHMPGGSRIARVHGPFVSDGEVEQIVAFLRAQGEPDYVESVTETVDDGGDEDTLPGIGGGDGGDSGDQLYDKAVALVCRERKASTSFVQRHLQIGYNRAARMIEKMESEGVISGPTMSAAVRCWRGTSRKTRRNIGKSDSREAERPPRRSVRNRAPRRRGKASPRHTAVESQPICNVARGGNPHTNLSSWRWCR